MVGECDGALLVDSFNVFKGLHWEYTLTCQVSAWCAFAAGKLLSCLGT